MARRRCKAKTKKGKRCKAPPPRGSAYCRAHDPDTPASARFGSHAQAREAGKQGGRPRKPRVVDVMRERVEDKVDEIFEVYEEAMAATRTVMVGYGEDASFEQVPDHVVRLKAADSLLDRTYGKPRQEHEHSGNPDRPLRLSHELLTDPELRDGLRQFKRRLADTRAERPGGDGSGD